MTTLKLPIPDVGGDQYYIQFIAECQNDGAWTLCSKTNCTLNTGGFEKVNAALENMRNKITPIYKRDYTLHYDIESIFVMLQELEDAHLNYNPKNKSAILERTVGNCHFSHVLKMLH